MTAGLPDAAQPQRSAFTGADVCGEAGLTLPDGIPHPMFDDDAWDFTDVVGLPVQMAGAARLLDFAAITDQRWRLVAKELIFAMLAPRHEAVAPLPRAYRTALHLSTANGRLFELTRFLNWLTQQGSPVSPTSAPIAARPTSRTAATCSTKTTPWSVSSAPPPAGPRRRRSSTWSATGNCSPLTGSPRACGPGEAPPPRQSRRCPAAGP